MLVTSHDQKGTCCWQSPVWQQVPACLHRHFSDFTYVHLMTDMNTEATVEAKQAFERLAGQHDIKIQHYHADNGLFAAVCTGKRVKVSRGITVMTPVVAATRVLTKMQHLR